MSALTSQNLLGVARCLAVTLERGGAELPSPLRNAELLRLGRASGVAHPVQTTLQLLVEGRRIDGGAARAVDTSHIPTIANMARWGAVSPVTSEALAQGGYLTGTVSIRPLVDVPDGLRFVDLLCDHPTPDLDLFDTIACYHFIPDQKRYGISHALAGLEQSYVRGSMSKLDILWQPLADAGTVAFSFTPVTETRQAWAERERVWIEKIKATVCSARSKSSTRRKDKSPPQRIDPSSRRELAGLNLPGLLVVAHILGKYLVDEKSWDRLRPPESLPEKHVAQANRVKQSLPVIREALEMLVELLS